MCVRVCVNKTDINVDDWKSYVSPSRFIYWFTFLGLETKEFNRNSVFGTLA